MKLAPGTMVSDSVRLLEPLGQGGMGAVWVGEHLGLKKRVAVKLILTEASHDPEFRQRFKREASIGARLNSPHCVQMLDYGVAADGTPYLVMELLQGTDLTHAVEIRGRMTLALVVGLVGQLAEVLERAHEIGIVHRDIKPDNIFLVGEDESFVKVLDFGVAKLKASGGDEVTETGAVVGSPEFMSPEQALSSKHVDHRSDLFSLAVVAYYALTGELPYETGGAQLWLRLATGERTPPSHYVPDLPAEVDEWFERALASRPEGRFQSAKEMAHGLLAIVPQPATEPFAPPPESVDSQALTRRMLSPLELPEAQSLLRPGPTPAAGRAPPAVGASQAQSPAATDGGTAADPPAQPSPVPPSVRDDATMPWRRPAAPAPRLRTGIILTVVLAVFVLALGIALVLLR